MGRQSQGMSEPQKVALITGGARRVGRAIAVRLAEAGYDVAFTYFNSAADAQSLSQEIAAINRKAVGICADLTDLPASIETVAKEFQAAFDRLDLLVNNASIYQPSGLQDVTLAAMRRMWAIHAEAPLLLCRQFEKHLRSRGGAVVNMLDLLAERPWPEYLAYCASKAALANLTLGLARELAPQVRVNGIAPGVVEWPPNYPQSDRDQYLKRVPLARAGTPQDVAEAVLFLGHAGGYVTGQILRLDGGRSIT
jgi:pteridine reductase